MRQPAVTLRHRRYAFGSRCRGLGSAIDLFRRARVGVGEVGQLDLAVARSRRGHLAFRHATRT